MPETIFVKPPPGLTVRDPLTNKALPPEGMPVEKSSHWLRRAKQGDVEILPVPAAGKPAKPAKPAAVADKKE